MMTGKEPDFVLTRSSTQDFLFFKTLPKPDPRKPARKDPLSSVLQKAYPDLLTGKVFLEGALNAFENTPEFTAMAVRIDAFNGDLPSNDSQYLESLRMDAAKAVADVCDNYNGVWGEVDTDILGCFIEGCEKDRTDAFADSIRDVLSAIRTETVSIGIARHPCLHFSKSRTFENALKALDHAAFFGPANRVVFDAISLNISADRLYEAGNIEGAIAEYVSGLRLDPANINIHNSLGVCYGTIKDYERAAGEFESALWLNPREVMAHYNLGLIHLHRENTDSAMECFEKAADIDPELFEVNLQLGRLHLEKEQSAKAFPHLQKAVRIRPDSGAAFRLLGRAHEAAGEQKSATDAYSQAVKNNPNDADSFSALGNLYGLAGDSLEVALAFCRQSVEIEPENGLYHYRLGCLLLRLDRREEAVKAFQKATRLGRDSQKEIDEIDEFLNNNKESVEKRVAPESLETDENIDPQEARRESFG